MSKGLSRQQVAILLVMRQRETTCTAGKGQYHGCTTGPQDIFDALYAAEDTQQMARKRQEIMEDAQREMSPEDFKGYQAWLATGEKLMALVMSEATQFYREKHPYMGKSREVSIERAFRSLRARGFVRIAGRRAHGYQWHTTWHSKAGTRS